MKIKVYKFGGSALASERGVSFLKNTVSKNERAIIVCSAIGKRDEMDKKLTDLLISLCDIKKKNAEHAPKNKICANSLSYEERGVLFEIYIKTLNFMRLICKNEKICKKRARKFIKTVYNSTDENYAISRGEFFTTSELARRFNGGFLNATDLFVFNGKRLDLTKARKKIYSALNENEKVFVPAFYASDQNGKVKLFPRGGGDLSGALAALAPSPSLYVNCTDVGGIKIAPPQHVKHAKTLSKISYKYLRLLSDSGSAPLSREAVNLICKRKIKTKILNAISPDKTTTTAKKQKGIFRAVCLRHILEKNTPRRLKIGLKLKRQRVKIIPAKRLYQLHGADNLTDEIDAITLIGKTFGSKKARAVIFNALKRNDFKIFGFKKKNERLTLFVQAKNAATVTAFLYGEFVLKKGIKNPARIRAGKP